MRTSEFVTNIQVLIDRHGDLEITTFEFANKKEARGVLKALNGIKGLLASPRNWMQGEEKEEIYKVVKGEEVRSGEYRYCLIGAAQETDGPFQHRVTELLAYQSCKLFVAHFRNCVDHMPTYMPTAPTELRADIARDIITSFNDCEFTKLRDVKRVINSAIKKCERFIAPKR